MKPLKYKVAQSFLWILALLCFSDLLYPSKGEEVNRIVPVVGRSLYLILLLLYVLNKKLNHDFNVKRSFIGRSLLLFGLYSVIFSFFLNFGSYIYNITTVVKILYWTAGFFSFYYAFLAGLITEKQLKYFGLFASVVYILVILRDFSNVSLYQGSKNYFVSNNSYILLRLSPLIFLPNVKFRKVLLILIYLGILISFKRGAILIFTIIFLGYIFKEWKTMHWMERSVFMVGTYALVHKIIVQNSEVFLRRLEDINNLDSAGSGRGKIFRLLIEDMLGQDLNPLALTFGKGFLSTKELLYNQIGYRISSHSDIFEIWYDFGIIGLVIYVLFILNLIQLYRVYKTTDYRMVIFSSIVIILGMSLFSINLFSPEMIYVALPLAFLEAKKINSVY